MKLKEVALTLVQEKTNPRISVRVGDRGAGLTLVALYRKLLDKYLPSFLEALKQEGPVNKVAALSRNWGNKAYVQVNIAEALAQEKAKPKFAEVLKKFLSEIKNTETVPYNFDKNTKFKIYKIKLNSRLNPSAKADIAIYDVIDPNIGLIVAEVVEDATGVSKKGIAAFQKLSGETQRAAQPQRPKLATFRGKKGYWITTSGGRRVFIEESKFKSYQKWTKWSKVGKQITKAGAVGLGLGVLAGAASGAFIFKALSSAATKVPAGKIIESIFQGQRASFKELLGARAKAATAAESKMATGKIFAKIGNSFAGAGKLLAITGVGLWAANALMAATVRKESAPGKRKKR